MTLSVRSRLCAAVLAFCAGGCAVRAVRTEAPVGLAWPPGEPRVVLERVIATRHSGWAAISWITGEKDAPLFERPYGVAWMGADLVVADPAARRLVRISADGKVTQSGADPDFSPLTIAACTQGLVVADSEAGRVAVFDAGLRRVAWLASGLERPTGLACDPDTVWVAETGAHRLRAFDREGRSRAIGERGSEGGQFNFPVALTTSPDALFVGDTLNFRIQRLDPASGAFKRSFGRLGDTAGDTPRLKGMAVDAAGNLWASDAHLDQVALYNSDGMLLLSLGRTGSNPGEFSFPAGIAAHPDGRVAVADALNRRVQVFRLLRGTAAP